MLVETTLFKNIFDTNTSNKLVFNSFDMFEEWLYKCHKIPGYKPKKGERNVKASPLMSPAVFNKGDTRKNANVLYWTYAALDVDEYEGTLEDALGAFKHVRHVAYSSASSRKDKAKFRIVFPLSEKVNAVDIRHFWMALSIEFKSLGDPQTKDLSRMYYVPAQYPGAYNFIHSHKDAPVLNVLELLKKHPYVEKTNSFLSSLPPAVQKKLIEHKKAKLNNTSYSWTGIHDCPFINRNLVGEYRAIGVSGWYAKMYAILVSTAGNAIKKGYPITPQELAALGHELDNETGGWYKNRPLVVEAERAIAYAINN